MAARAHAEQPPPSTRPTARADARRRVLAGIGAEVERAIPLRGLPIAAALYPSRTFLVASTPSEMTDILDRLHDAGIEKIRVAWSDEPGEAGTPLLDGSCYRIESRQRLSERQVTIATAATRLAGHCDATEPARR